ncbi:type I restriction endonuclease subunit R [Flavobacterium columnare]|uniref:Type I restriction enzyme endonuclease subunit n=1 Tax=Flavobacterium columnare TaxID=996 RepID=A0AA94EZE6_9FLAO|nr:HsdR family type I site-specific deoxyribonuclease [Flavobacterium columnare]MCH4830615.1 HsdR family type I site-specific deoxyribonuclease [Flavobacterium columnare]MCH4833449.1 HsdR family type I site-specific deoxyribonuclease [Flavobacterium columnare]
MSINPLERVTQNRIIQLFKSLGYTYYGNWEERENNSNVEESYLRAYLQKQKYTASLIEKAIAETTQLAHTNASNIYERNKNFYSLLRYGVKAKENVGKQNESIHLIDWENWDNNDFGIAEEVTLKGNKTRRPDIVLYVNGIALGVLELKRGTVDISESIRQNISNQKEKFNENFFTTIQFILAGNNTQGLRYGTIETFEKYYLAWKEDETDNTGYKLDKYLTKLCNKERFLDIIYNGVVFDAGRKKLPRPHQYFALKEAQKFIQQNEGGIIWHTQGSGKSILMIILAKWILENVTNSRVVILTDRTELDKQIADTFEGIGEKDIARTRSGNELMYFLTQPKPRLIASLIHKFGNKGEVDYKTFIEEIKSNPIQIQGKVFVFVDECHRTQGGKLNETMKAVLKNAIFIGFTGTPLLQKDKQTTMDIFGRYIHTYKFNEAVTDGVVKDLVYEGRDIEQKLSSQDKVDAWFEAKTKGLNDFQKSELKKRWGTMQNVLSSRSRMDKIVADILFDFSVKPRLASEKGNAILVASSIYEACKYYELFLNTPFKNKCAIITSYNPQTKDITTEDGGEDSETDKEFIYKTYENILENIVAVAGKTKTETYEDDSKELFIKQPARMKLLIVVSKLLTGFDSPPCSYIYIDKKMQDHTLFQAICRTNRLDTDDKDFGYIVDYMELFGKVTDAIDVYTSELDTEDFTKEEVEIQLKDRLKLASERIENALEELEILCEPVEAPRTDLEYIHYFCGNTEIPTDLKENEFKRVALYKAIVAYIRAYANIKAELDLAGFTTAQINHFEERLDFYLKLRETIRIASGETLDLKAYEADMRHLIDNYIQAEESKTITPFEDISLLDLMESDIFSAIETLPEGIKSNPEAVAEVIENSISSKIVEKHLLDPKYFEKMSQLLYELIEQRKKKSFEYREYLKKAASLIKKVNAGKSDDIPTSMNTIGKRAIYNYLERDEELTIACEEAIQYSKKDGFRENIQKQNEIQAAIYSVVKDEEKTIEIYRIVENNKSDY